VGHSCKSASGRAETGKREGQALLDQNVARPSGCRVETRLDAWRFEVIGIAVLNADRSANEERRDESRRGSLKAAPRKVLALSHT